MSGVFFDTGYLFTSETLVVVVLDVRKIVICLKHMDSQAVLYIGTVLGQPRDMDISTPRTPGICGCSAYSQRVG